MNVKNRMIGIKIGNTGNVNIAVDFISLHRDAIEFDQLKGNCDFG